MDKVELINNLIEYRCIQENDKSFFLNLFDDVKDEDFKIVEGDYHVVDGKGVYYPATKVHSTFFNRKFECTYYDNGCHFTTEYENENIYFYCKKKNFSNPLSIEEFDYAYRDDTGYYTYVYRNNYVHFMYLSAEKAAQVDFEKWKYNFKIDDERDTYGIGLDVNDTYSESDTLDEVRAILSDPAKHGFDKLIESKRTA